MKARFRIHHLDLLFPSYVLIALIPLWVSGTAWLGEWQWTFDNINGAMVLLGPYAGSAAAWRVVSAQINDHLYATTPRGWAVPLRVGTTVLVSAGLAWLVVGASAVIGTALVVHGGPTPVWVLLAGACVLIACIAAGSAVGHLWPSRIGALLVAPTLFVLGGLGASGHLPNLLHQGPGTASLAGLRWNPANFWLEMAALVLAAATFALLALRRRGWRATTQLALPMATAVAFAAVVTLTSAYAPERFVYSQEQPTLCASEAPAICVAPSNARALASFVRGFARFVPAARELGLELPGSFRQVLPAHRGGAEWGELLMYADGNSPATSDQVVTSLVTPGDCRAYFNPVSPPPEAVHQAQSILGTLLTQVQTGHRAVLHDPAMMAWARQTYRDLRDCRLSALPPPPSTP